MHPSPQHLVVVGGGMVAHRLVEALRDRDAAGAWRVTVLAEEPRRPYDRVALTSWFSGRSADELQLGDPALWDDPLVTLRRDDAVVAIDRDARTVTTARGRVERYDHLVLATGSSAWVPPIEGADTPGVFVYRTLDDVAALRGYVEELQEQGRTVRGAVLGGGLLGLEAAGALQALGARTTVLQVGTHLMSAQVDLGGEAVSGDGLVLQGRTLYAVERQGDVGYIVKIELSRGLAAGTVVSRTTDPSFNDPTTAALTGRSLLVVNSQFGERAAGVEPGPFTVSRVPAP